MSQKVFRLGLKEGKAGDSVSVYTNCFEISRLPDRAFHHYHVEFPGNDKISRNRDRCLEIVDKLQIQYPKIFTPRAAYDGKHNMYRTIPLDLSNNSAEFSVSMKNKAGTENNNNNNNQSRGGTIQVRIVRVAMVDPKSLLNVINGQTAHSSDSLTTVTFLNILIRMKPILSCPSNKTSFFTKEQRENLGGGLQIWRGLFQSVRPSIGRLVVNVDTSVAVMYRDGSLLDLVMEFMEFRNARDLAPANFKGPQRKRLDDFLKNLMVCSNVPRREGNPRWKKITGVVMNCADEIKFSYDKAGGDEISVTDYYKSAYNYRLQYGKIICVSVRRDNTVIFPLEILQVKPGQFYKKNLTPRMTAKALEFSSQKPDVRIRALEGSTELLGYADSDFLRQSGVTVKPQLLTVNGRILHPPPLLWGQNKHQEPKGGVWNLIDRAFYIPGVIQAWSVIVFDTKPAIMADGYSTVRNFITGFVRCCCTLGMSFPRNAPQIIAGRPGSGPQGHREDMDQAARAAIDSFRDQFNSNTSPRPTFILVILPEAATDIYTSIKNWGDIVRGCPTQCVKSGKVFKPNNSYFSNLALKLNVKVDGVNSIPASSPLKSVLSRVPTMIIGIDVSHSTSSGRPSVAGLVASMDEHFTQYGAITSIQPPLKEIIEEIDPMIEKALQNFFVFWKKRGQPVLPQRIIIYRDGVSEGQFNEVVTEELQKIKAALASIWKEQKFPGKPPTLTFLIVGKKHHVRFFPKEHRHKDRSGNCPAGMVVDRDIISPTDYDFYLQSHSGILGTSRPSHYSVVMDENDLGADQLQALSYMLCYTYGRATRSVSIPAPVYYADIVCARGKIHSPLMHDGSDSISGAGSNSLEDHKEAFKPIADFLKRKMYFM